MTPIPLIMCAALYIWAAVGSAWHERWTMCVVFICYALANIGFAIEGMK